MLTRLRVRGFKSLADTEVQLTPLTVVFGPNAAGKSNFLESLIALSRLVNERTVDEALSPPLRGRALEMFRLPPGGLEELIGEREASFSLEADLTVARPGTDCVELLYRVEPLIRPGKGELRVRDEHLSRAGSAKPRIEYEAGQITIRTSKTAGRPYKESLPLNHTIASNHQFGGDRHPEIEALRQELRAWRVYYLDPRGAMREEQGPREVEDIGVTGEWLAPFLYRLKQSDEHRKRFDAIRRTLRSVVPSISEIDVELDKQGTLDIKVKQEGIAYSSRVISEGTLRILALCAIAVNPWYTSLIAFEEPENGVHPGRIELIAQLLASVVKAADRQIVVTTHSPTLVGEMVRLQRKGTAGISLHVCRRRDGGTVIEPFETSELFNGAAIEEGLTDTDSPDAIKIGSMLTRGWLDG